MEELVIETGGSEYIVKFMKNDASALTINGKIYNIELLKKIDLRIWSLAVNNAIHQIEFDLQPDGSAVIYLDGFSFDVRISDSTKQFLKKFLKNTESGNNSGLNKIKAPMPGMIVKIIAQEGAAVEKGDNLIIIEAMKMENVLKSPVSGTVGSIKVKEGSAVEKGGILMELVI